MTVNSYKCLAIMLLFFCALAAQAQTHRSPVLVELFTSEGCSSCPPVDRHLSELQQQQPVAGAEIILLGFHVDYWDHDGWKDRFSSPQFTRRQEEYASHSPEGTPYTPQVIVDGNTRQYDPSSIQKDIGSSANQPKPITLSLHAGTPNSFSVRSTGTAKDVYLFFALAEDDLRTEVKGGENGGRVLQHAAVVRKFIALGAFREGESKPIPITFASDWKKEKLRAVCFAQDRKSGKILGVASLPISSLKAAEK